MAVSRHPSGFVVVATELQLAHSRRKGLVGDVFQKKLKLSESSVFLEAFRTLPQLSKGITSGKSIVAGFHAQNLRLLTQSLFTLISDRVDSLKGIRKDEDKFVFAVALYRDLQRLRAAIVDLLQTLRHFSSSGKVLPIVVKGLQQTWQSMSSTWLTRKCAKVEDFIGSLVRSALKRELQNRFVQNPFEFLTLRNQYSGLSCYSAEQNENSGEAHILSILSMHGYEKFLAASFSTSEKDQSLFQPLYSRVISETLRSLLSAILDNKLVIDEGGLYKLYRLLLGIEEIVVKARFQTNHPANQRFINDNKAWTLAQSTLDTLNQTLFEIAQKKTHAGLVLHESSALLEEAHAWRVLAKGENYGRFSFIAKLIRWRKRHKGTVFVVLKLNENI